MSADLQQPLTQPKSPAAHQAAMERFFDLQTNPIGTQRGENFSVASNYRIPLARIYVVNHSATVKRKYVSIPISTVRGAEEALVADKELAKVYNVDTLIRQVEKGRDMNRYKTEIKPVAFKLRIPGGREVILPPAKAGEKPVMVEVPEGTWDLYLGNYDRMRGFEGRKPRDQEQFDQKVQAEEQNRWAISWRQRHNPVLKWTEDGETNDFMIGGTANPFGFIEFIRVTQRMVMEPIDRDYLTAFDIQEA